MKKILLSIILLLIFFGLWQTCKAVDFQLLIDYPTISGSKLGPNSTLPEIINYVYKFALLACGITAFVSILIGAYKYITSAGNTSKAEDAKGQITQALLGILILLSAVLILRTINPDLVKLSLTLPATEPGITGPGITLNYKCLYCNCMDPPNPNCTPNKEVWGCQSFPSSATASLKCQQALSEQNN